MTTPRTVIDMAGQVVHIGDTVAAAFRTYNGTYPQLRLGVVEEIVDRIHPGRGNGKLKREAIMVRWTRYSHNEAVNLSIREDNEKKIAKGKKPSPFFATNHEMVTPIFTEHKRFVRMG